MANLNLQSKPYQQKELYINRVFSIGMGIFKRIFDRLRSLGGNTLYYPGCLTKFVMPEMAERYEKILKDLGVDFIKIEEFNCCGSPVMNAGYREDFLNLMEKNREIFRKYGIKRIITNCPSCAYVFREEYGIPAKHITEVLLEKIDKLSGKQEGEPAVKIGYHDPCHLGRKLNVYDAPRKVLEKLGYEVVEARSHGQKSLCCGGGGGLKTNFPKLSAKVGKQRIKEFKADEIVTCCPLCYQQLKESSEGKKKIFELSELIKVR